MHFCLDTLSFFYKVYTFLFGINKVFALDPSNSFIKRLIQFSREILKKVTGKQCRPRSDAAQGGV